MSVRAVACFDLPDGDRAFLFWIPDEGKFQLTSDQDSEYSDCIYPDVRRTIYWALGEDPESAHMPLIIQNLTCKHNEILENGEPWTERCTPESCTNFLNHDWHSYAANRIFLSFAVA